MMKRRKAMTQMSNLQKQKGEEIFTLPLTCTLFYQKRGHVSNGVRLKPDPQ